MKVSFEKRLILFFAIIFTGIIILGIVASRNNRTALETSKLVAHTKEVIAESQLVLSLSKDIVMGSQRYVITGDSVFLGHFTSSSDLVFSHISKLKILTKDNDLQQARADSLKLVMEARIKFSDRYIRARNEKGMEAAAKIIATGRGKVFTDEIRDLVGQIEGQENSLLVHRESDSDKSITAFNNAFYALLASVFILIAVVFFYILYNSNKRARADEELKTSRENFKRLFEYVPYPTWVYDLQTLHFLEVNLAAINQYGYSRDEFLKMDILAIRPIEEIPKVMDSIETRGADDIQRTSGWKHRLRNGQLIDVEITSQLFNFSGHKSALVIANNITERKKTEEAIKQTNHFLDTILENIPNMIFVKDAEELRFVRFNKAGEDLLGYSRKDLIGKNDYDFFPDDQADFFTGKDKEVLKKGILLDIPEEPINTAHGDKLLHTKKIPISDEQGKPLYLLGISEDITERKKAETHLQELNERFLKIFNLSPVAMSISNIDDGKITQVNEAFEKLFILNKEDAIGKTFADLKIRRADERPEILKILEQSGGHAREVEMKLRKSNGEMLDALSSVEIIEIDNQKYLLSAAMDISRRKKAETQIINLNAELGKNIEQFKNLNNELEAFTYSVSHDLRAPLRVIDGFAEILIHDFKDKLDEEGNRTLAVIKSNAQRMGQLIDDLLNLSRIGRKELVMHQVNMEQLVKNVVEEEQDAHPSRVSQVVTKPLNPANCDSALIRQVWINLVSNAFKYSRYKEKSIVEIGSYKKENEIIYYIKDNGVGFDMKYAGKLFGVFQRLHKMSEFEGTGVGLAIVQRIVSKHGGKVWAEAEVDKGATFFFSLPV